MSEEPKKRPRGRPKTVDREGAIERAMYTYWSEGLYGLSINETCRRISISKPALYREFGNEDGLLKAALEHYRQLVIVPFLELLEGDLGFSDVIEMAIIAMTSTQDTPPGCLFTRMRLAGSRLGPQAAEFVQELERERSESFVNWYRRGLATGQANPAISPELAGGYIDTQTTSVLVQVAAGKDPDSVRSQARLAFRILHA